MMLGAAPCGMPLTGAEYVKTDFPAVRLGRFANTRGNTELSSGKTLYFFASRSKTPCNSLSLAGFCAARSYASVKSAAMWYSSQL